MQGLGDRRSQAGHCRHPGQTRQKSRTAHGTRWVPRGGLGERRWGTSHSDTAERTAPARRRIIGAAGPTLPPPTAPRRPPRRGVLAVGRAGTAAGAPGPEVSGHSQPWLCPAWGCDGFRTRAAQPLATRREEGPRRAGRTPRSPMTPPLWGRSLCWLSGG